MKKGIILFVLFLFVAVSGCTSIGKVSELSENDLPEGEWGYLAVQMSALNVNNKEDKTPFIRLYLHQEEKAWGKELGFRKFQEIRILTLPKGKYRLSRYGIVGLNAERFSNYQEFDVKAGEVTYVGEYRFVLEWGGLLNAFIERISFDHRDNLPEVYLDIVANVEKAGHDDTSTIEIRYQSPFQY